MTDIDLMYDAAQMAKRREQRRYEIARDCLVAFISTGSEIDGYASPNYAPKEAIEFADALLAEMERTK